MTILDYVTILSSISALIVAVVAILTLRTSNKQLVTSNKQLATNVEQYQASQEQDRKDRREHQARQLTAWVDETLDLQVLCNRSDMPAYDVVLTFTIKDRDGRQAPVAVDSSYRHVFRTLPPGNWKFAAPVGWGEAGTYPGVELAFRDAYGQCWLRTSRGELNEMSESPINYYGVGYPYNSDSLIGAQEWRA